MAWYDGLIVLLVVSVIVAMVALFGALGGGSKKHGGRRRSVRPPPIGPIRCAKFETKNVPETSGTTTICLSCIDYRFVQSVPELLEEEEGVEFFDGFSLAGGSLGYNQTVYTDWPQTWLDTVQLAITLHKITQIVIVEHMDCGMYTSIYGPLTPPQERAKHLENMQTFTTAMNALHPTLTTRGYLVYLDGHAERLV